MRCRLVLIRTDFLNPPWQMRLHKLKTLLCRLLARDIRRSDCRLLMRRSLHGAYATSRLHQTVLSHYRIDNISAVHTAPCLHPEMSCFMQVDEAIGYHKPLTTCACHNDLLFVP